MRIIFCDFPPARVHMYNHKAADFRSLVLEYFNLKACNSCSCLLEWGGVPKAAGREARECLSDERWGILKTILNYPDEQFSHDQAHRGGAQWGGPESIHPYSARVERCPKFTGSGFLLC